VVCYGIDPEKDILPHMGFQPIMRDPRSMNPLIFKPEPMGLERLLLGLSLSERITYDQARNTIFINFEGFQVGTTADVDLVRREIEARCKAIGRKVALVANYDGFYLDPMASDAYFSMITYMQNRYYSSASRYTTSAFMRLKLGAGLAERNLAPHVAPLGAPGGVPKDAAGQAKGPAVNRVPESLPRVGPVHESGLALSFRNEFSPSDCIHKTWRDRA